MQLTEPSLADLFLLGGVEPTSEASAETDNTEPTVEHSEPTAGSKLPSAASDDVVDATADAVPAKARRGRRPKAQPETDPTTDPGTPMMDAPTEEIETVVSAEPDTAADNDFDDTPEVPPAKPRRGRPHKAEAASQFAVAQTEQRNDRPTANPPTADRAEAGAPAAVARAVHWDPVTGIATFDWSTIEQVAATEGPNQGMAKLLLVARAEGANSRWPF